MRIGSCVFGPCEMSSDLWVSAVAYDRANCVGGQERKSARPGED